MNVVLELTLKDVKEIIPNLESPDFDVFSVVGELQQDAKDWLSGNQYFFTTYKGITIISRSAEFATEENFKVIVLKNLPSLLKKFPILRTINPNSEYFTVVTGVLLSIEFNSCIVE